MSYFNPDAFGLDAGMQAPTAAAVIPSLGGGLPRGLPFGAVLPTLPFRQELYAYGCLQRHEESTVPLKWALLKKAYPFLLGAKAPLLIPTQATLNVLGVLAKPESFMVDAGWALKQSFKQVLDGSGVLSKGLEQTIIAKGALIKESQATLKAFSIPLSPLKRGYEAVKTKEFQRLAKQIKDLKELNELLLIYGLMEDD